MGRDVTSGGMCQQGYHIDSLKATEAEAEAQVCDRSVRHHENWLSKQYCRQKRVFCVDFLYEKLRVVQQTCSKAMPDLSK